MMNDLLAVLIDVHRRITPTEIRVQVVEPDWHRHRGYRRVKPCWIYEHHTQVSSPSVDWIKAGNFFHKSFPSAVIEQRQR